MAKQDKIVAGILATHGSLGIVWTVWMASTHGNPPVFLLSNLALAGAGIAAGLGCLKGKRWAAYLGLGFWAIQLFHVLTPEFQFSFTLGLNVVVSAGWYKSGELGINLFALVMLIWLACRMGSPNSALHRAHATA